MEAHREHVYQRLVDGGWSHSASAGLCGLAAVLVCASVAVTWRSAPVAGAALSGCVVLAYLSAPRVLVPRGGDTA